MSTVQQEVKFTEDADWTETFISIIQSKPAIYKTNLPEHSNRNIISSLWVEVCEAMFPTWPEMTSVEKFAKEKELQNRWRNLRTCFRRELSKQKHSTSGQAVKKRRKYVYFDQLLFLLPTMEDRPTVSECSPMSHGESETESDHITQSIDLEDTLNNTSTASTSTQKPVTMPMSKSKTQAKRNPTYEESLLAILKEMKEEQIDEDKSFLLFLVPSFKQLNYVQKLEAKMEFLATLKRLAQPSQGFVYHVPQRHEAYPNYGHQQFIRNYSSESSTPMPVLSEVLSSNSDPVSPQQDLSNLS